MKAMRLLAAGLCLGLIAVGARADEKKSDYAKQIVGKWEITKTHDEGPPVGTKAELTKDGKIFVTFKMGDQDVKLEGTYKVEGDKVNHVLKAGEDEHKGSFTIKKLTKTELITENEQGKVVELKRVK